MSRALQKRYRTCGMRSANDWVDRCLYWREAAANEPLFTRSRRIREPLILAGHGARLWINNGCLMVRSGFTHFPQQAEQFRFFPNDPKRPDRIIIIDGSGSISFDAMDWLARNDVPLIRLNWRGEVQTILGTNGSNIDPKRIDAQQKAKATNRSIEIARAIISKKLKNSISTLNSVLPRSRSKTQAIEKLQAYLARAKGARLNSVSQLMGIEGAAAITYFGAWQSLSIKWESIKRKPIPSDWYRIGLRSSITRQKTKNRNASHPVNAMLNYAYAVLESQVRIQIIASGRNPKIGVLHKSRLDRDALVLDLMEPLRPIVDRRVLEFVRANTFEPNDFVIRSDGVCRLQPNLATALVTMIDKIAEPAIMFP